MSGWPDNRSTFRERLREAENMPGKYPALKQDIFLEQPGYGRFAARRMICSFKAMLC